MQITEVKIRPVKHCSKEKLRAFASIIFDNCFAVKEIKIIDGENGHFVAMPSRKAMSKCPKCYHRNASNSKFCNACGEEITISNKNKFDNHRIFMDIAHPINVECREMIHKAIIDEYKKITENPIDNTEEDASQQFNVSDDSFNEDFLTKSDNSETAKGNNENIKTEDSFSDGIFS